MHVNPGQRPPPMDCQRRHALVQLHLAPIGAPQFGTPRLYPSLRLDLHLRWVLGTDVADAVPAVDLAPSAEAFGFTVGHAHLGRLSVILTLTNNRLLKMLSALRTVHLLRHQPSAAIAQRSQWRLATGAWCWQRLDVDNLRAVGTTASDGDGGHGPGSSSAAVTVPTMTFSGTSSSASTQ